MKVIQILLLSYLCLFLFSCDDDDREDFLFNATSLKQTQWTGSVQESYVSSTGVPVSSTASTGIFFVSDNEGKYSMKYTERPLEGTFEYTINNKILTIKKGGVLEGDWLLIQFDKNKMVLEKGTGGEDAYKGILNLAKAH